VQAHRAYLVAPDGGVGIQDVHPAGVLRAVKHGQGTLGDREVQKVQHNDADATVGVLQGLQSISAQQSTTMDICAARTAMHKARQ
jgi:hypothetical protein